MRFNIILQYLSVKGNNTVKIIINTVVFLIRLKLEMVTMSYFLKYT